MSKSLRELEEELTYEEVSQRDNKMSPPFEGEIETLTYQEALGIRANGNKYLKECKGIHIDVYDVLQSFNVTNSAIAHAVKKLLAGGQRGYKDTKQDYLEAIASIERAIELEGQK